MENPNYRLEAFSDGVFAIALTLLIIEIKIPAVESVHTRKELWNAFAHNWPSWLAFFVSFITTLISWVAHSHIFKLIDKSTNKLIYTNAFLLLSVITLPFFTTALAEYLKTDLAGPAITLYCGFSIIHSLSWIAIQHAILHPVSLCKPAADLKKVKKVFNYTKLNTLLVFRKMKESFVGVERSKSAAASPTKRIERNPIFELEICKPYYQIFHGRVL